MISSHEQLEPGQLSLGRLERLSDVVYAVTLILLLATLRFAPKDLTSEEVFRYLLTEGGSYVGYVISFLIIAFYWITQQQYFSHYRKTDKTHTMLELIYLMFLVIIPFGNQFLSAHPDKFLPRVVITIDMTLVGLMLCLSWRYATRNDRLTKSGIVDQPTRSMRSREALMLPALGVIGLAAGYFYTYAWDLVLVIGSLVAIGRRNNKRGANNKQGTGLDI